LDDKKFYLGIDFLDMVKSLNEHDVHHGEGATLCCPLEESDREGKMLPALQF